MRTWQARQFPGMAPPWYLIKLSVGGPALSTGEMPEVTPCE